jgi:hypothetical protein
MDGTWRLCNTPHGMTNVNEFLVHGGSTSYLMARERSMNMSIS